MERGESAIVVKSPAREGTESESLLSALVFDISQQMQSALESMHKMTSGIHVTSRGITEEMIKCREAVEERRASLEEERVNVQRAAYSALQMLTGQEEE